MKLLLVCTSMVLLLSVVELSRPQIRRRDSIAQSYRAANVSIIPDSVLEVCFDDVSVTLGMEVTPTQAMDLPNIEFDFEPGCYYTFLCISPDYPSRDDPSQSNSLLALFVNMMSVDSGDLKLSKDSCAIARWRGPNPAPGTGLHRYLLYVYKQSEYIDTTDGALLSLQNDRYRYSLRNFVRSYNLFSPPKAGNFFYSKYPKEKTLIDFQDSPFTVPQV